MAIGESVSERAFDDTILDHMLIGFYVVAIFQKET